MLSEAWSAISSFLFPSRTMTTSTPTNLIISSHRNWDTEAFFSMLWFEAINNRDPIQILEQYPVSIIRFRKTKKNPSEHEFLDFEVADHTGTIPFILERTVSMDDLNANQPNNTTVDQFLNHPHSKKLLNVILNSFGGISPSVVAAATAVALPILGSAAVIPAIIHLPLSLTQTSESQTLLPLTTESKTSPSSYTSAANMAPEYSLVDQASMAMAALLHAVSNSGTGKYMSRSLDNSKPFSDARAVDQFLGGDRLYTDGYISGVQIGHFKPRHLKLFHLALLAHVVHIEYPLYALFLNQCYWFTSTVYYAAQVIDYDLSHNALSGLPKYLSTFADDEKDDDEIFLPFHLFIAEGAGRWKGIRISGCKRVVLSSIVHKFHELYDNYMKQVFYLLYLFQNYG